MHNTVKNNPVILSLHWGFSIGGIAQYTAIIDNVDQFKAINIHNVVVLKPGSHVDRNVLRELKSVSVIELSTKLDLSVLSKIKREILRINPDLIMTHGFNGHFIMLCEKMFFDVRIPTICSYHGLYHATTPIRYIFGYIYNKLTEFYIKKCVVGVVVVAEHCKRHLLNKGVSEELICVIHNGIDNKENMDEEKRNALRQEWGVNDDEVLIGLASRLDRVKGLNYLLDAYVQVTNKYNKIKLVLIGTGVLEEDLKAKTIKNNISDKVIFTGFRSDVSDCLHAIDIFVLPSLAEYHSIGLLEAMRSGKAIISTDVGGNTESVRNNKEAIVVPPADSEALSGAIMRLLSDVEYRNKLAANARQRFVDEFTSDVTIEKTATWLYENANK